MKFKYLAKKGPKEKVEGFLEVASEEEAIKAIVRQGLAPVRVEKVEEAAGREGSGTKPPGGVPRRISQATVLYFTRNLYNLLKARVGMLKALLILEKQVDQPSLKRLISDIYSKVKEGADFSSTLGSFPRIFSPFYISLVKVGEVSGRLEFSLEKVCSYLEQQQEIRRKVVSSLAYPLMMVTVGIGTTIVLFTFVIPRLSGLFTDLGQELPLITRVLLDISSWFSRPLFWWIVAVAGGMFFLYQRFSTRKLSFRDFLKKTPFFKEIILLESVTTFSYTLSLLLKSGVSLLDALGTSQSTLQDKKLAAEIGKVREEVVRGGSLADNIAYLESFPKFFSHMIAIGEEAGMLPDVIDATTQVLTKDLDGRLRVLSSLIEPVIIFVIGIILGVVVIALLLPILQMGALNA